MHADQEALPGMHSRSDRVQTMQEQALARSTSRAKRKRGGSDANRNSGESGSEDEQDAPAKSARKGMLPGHPQWNEVQ